MICSYLKGRFSAEKIDPPKKSLFYTPDQKNNASTSMKAIQSYSLVIFWGILILVASTIGLGVGMPPTWTDLISWDKVGHAIAYGMFTFLLIIALSHTTDLGKSIGLGLVISICYGIAMEWVQYTFFPNRYFEYFDILANVVGSLGSAIVLHYIFKHKIQ